MFSRARTTAVRSAPGGVDVGGRRGDARWPPRKLVGWLSWRRRRGGHFHEAFISPMSMSAASFHPSVVERMPPPPLPPLASETRVVAVGPGLETELNIDARLRELPRAHEDFVLIREAGEVTGHEGKLALIRNEVPGARRFVDAVDPARAPARVVLSRIIESFSQLCTIVLRLQDEGIAHTAICLDSVVYDSCARSVRLARFCNAVQMHPPHLCSGLGLNGRSTPQGDHAVESEAPELSLLRKLRGSSKERVEACDLPMNAEAVPTGLAGLELTVALARLEGAWRGWDVYTLTKLYTHLIETICPRWLSPSSNSWLAGILRELRAGWEGGTPRPSLLKIKRAVEAAWYEGGDVQSCQEVVDALETQRESRTRHTQDRDDLPPAARTD